LRQIRRASLLRRSDMFYENISNCWKSSNDGKLLADIQPMPVRILSKSNGVSFGTLDGFGFLRGGLK